MGSCTRTMTPSAALACLLVVYPGYGLDITSRESKALFNIFQITTFPNEECAATNGLYGTCLSASECNGLGGLSAGKCAQGFGLCCVLSSNSCGDTISRNLTYIRNPGYPATYSEAGDCEWKITKSQENICQIRLDFETMEIADPNVVDTGLTGRCETDTFQGIQAQTGSDTPLICGYNTGQHLYLDAGAYTSSEASVKFRLTGTTARQWNILE